MVYPRIVRGCLAIIMPEILILKGIFMKKIVFVILRGNSDDEMVNFNSWLKAI